jgi:hypothetical protein
MDDLDRVKLLLWNDWDPIGINHIDGAPQSEYDNYAPKVLGMAREGASIDAIAAYLGKVEVEWMGGTPGEYGAESGRGSQGPW